MFLYLQEGAKDQFAKIAVQKGFELLRSSGKHNVWKHPSGAQITSPKTTSDWRSIKNFASEINYRLKDFKPEVKPKVDKVIDTVRKKKDLETRLSSAQRRLSSNKMRTGNPSSFKELSQKIDAVKNAPNELQKRMERGIINTMKSWDFNTKKVEAEKILRSLQRNR